MKILLYAHDFHPSVGGAETLVRMLAEGFTGRGCEVVVATATSQPDADGGFPFEVQRRPSLRSLWRLIGGADLVHLAGPVFVPLALALLRGRRVVIEHHGYQAVCPNGLLFQQPAGTACPGHFRAGRYGECLRCVGSESGGARAALKLLATFPRRWMSRRASANLAVTKHVQARLELPRTRVIYHGVRDAAAAAVEPERGGDLVFAYVGRLVAEKGLPLLVDAAAALARERSDFRVRFIGDGPERARLEAAADAAGVRRRVEFTGFLRGEAFDRAVADAAAVVMPSIWEETAGLAAMEHMMRGRPVVAAEIGGLAEVVGPAGLKFPAGDAAALADQLRRLLDEPGLLRELGAEARRRALTLFQYERMIDEHLASYAKLRGTPAAVAASA